MTMRQAPDCRTDVFARPRCRLVAARAFALPPDCSCADYPEGTSLKVVFGVTELQKVRRRAKAVRAIRCSTELEGSRSTNTTRADQIAYVRGTIAASELRDHVRRCYNLM